MQYIRCLILGCVALVLAGAALLAADTNKPSTPGPQTGPERAAPPAESGSHAVRVYYFHTSSRCVSCRKIDALTNQAIETAFAKELKDRKLTWEVVNIDEPPNKHFVQDYKLYTKSVVVVDSVKGEQVRWKNLEKVWQLLNNDQSFVRYIQEEVRVYLEGRS
jgi:hypothetical protein